jgi:predicted ferric reductase
MSPLQKKNTWLLALAVPAAVGVALLAQAGSWMPGWQSWLVRTLALSGYLLVFLATLSSASLPALAKAFGRPFVAVHHVATVAAFAAMVAHPLAYAAAFGSLEPLVPRAASLYDFFLWAGRPALVLFLVAVVAGALRLAFKKGWRYFHLAVYVAFLLVTVHANLIGTTFAGLPARIASWFLAAVATVVFVRKRLQRRSVRPAARPAAPATPSA